MDNSYELLVDAAISDELIGITNFYDIVKRAEGIHPMEIIRSLYRLHKDSIIDDITMSKIVQNISDFPQEQSEDYDKSLPIPHQVDYDWRFSNSGMRFLVERINQQIDNKSVRHITFVGSPSLFRYYCEYGSNDVEYYLIDFNAKKHIKSRKLSANAHVVDCNLNYDLDVEFKIDKIHADLIVMDPPWYPEYYKKFFEICNIVGDDKCYVFGVFPPLLTRASVSDERDNLDLYIQKFGFDKLQYEPLCVEYFTPPFEQNVLRANKINNYPMCWRKGDFFTTSRIHKIDELPYNLGVVIRNGGWTEKSIGNVRFKIRQSTISEDTEFSIRLEHLYANDIYPSVSRRYKGHEKINIWTSGNRVFYCSNIPIFFIILEQLNEDNIVTFIEDEYGETLSGFQKQQIRDVQNCMRSLIDLEMVEYGSWHE